ncbi:MAG: hypothetical protein Q7U93_01490, partial [Nitrosomonas sp.]|nr:hypothetical protein [Nitrosomonas sp.]
EKIIQAGGAPRIRSKKLTEPGSLAALSTIRLVDLTPELVTEWAKVEVVTRPTRARLALRLLRAFLNWCSRHSAYKAIVTGNAAQSRGARESLGKAKVKHDVLRSLYVCSSLQPLPGLARHVGSGKLKNLSNQVNFYNGILRTLLSTREIEKSEA